ncbi:MULTISPECIES: LysR family transcriptional regulator [unclassified Rhizobium]|uniref:LysR family transcriptional regulator n=1 Tax=unclassified Rhizobium TaxID=2613769 RepID=UPI0010478C06|nr:MULTISPECIES: LysR family transcriptional regulator [unclassified Rhizobium]MBB4166284.1 LysR family glycine cleavage system transcriptional activator [Rhizobium sp. BK538]TCM81827.1 LysR family glycine cleavage system transcriptional activator [Rhizobium sp. BK068]
MTLPRKLMPDLTTLQSFESAARHGNFTRAALELNLTQSAISRQIKDLETQLGVLLFERVRQRAILSEAGKRLLPEARRLLHQTEEMMIRAASGADATATLSVATLPTFGSRWLTPRLPDFLAAHPGSLVDIASRSELFDFDQESFDLAIHYGQPIWARATCTFLCDEKIVPVASPTLLQSDPVARPVELAHKPLLHLATRPRLWRQWFEHCDIDVDPSYRGNRFDQFSMIIEAAAMSMGFALLPLYLIEQELSSGKLQIVFDQPMSTENSYYVVTPDGKREHALGLAFTAWLLSQVSIKDPTEP